MADEKPTGGKLGDILQKDTAGIPNWGWLLIIGAGIAATYVVPKFLAGASQQGSQTSTDNGTSASNLGLAVDPTSGLPYALTGLYPSGGTAGATNLDLAGTNSLLTQILNRLNNPPPAPVTNNPPPTKPPTSNPPPTKPPTKPPTQGGNPPKQPVQAQPRYVTVKAWPNILSTLSGIASQNGISLARIEQLNPQIKNPDLIYAGQQVRIS